MFQEADELNIDLIDQILGYKDSDMQAGADAGIRYLLQYRSNGEMAIRINDLREAVIHLQPFKLPT